MTILNIAMKQRPFISKKHRKKSAKKCRICGEEEYATLDVHRIKEGSEGGKYTYGNTVVLCAKCHRLQQADKIKVIGWKKSTTGRLLHIIDKNGKEKFIKKEIT